MCRGYLLFGGFWVWFVVGGLLSLPIIAGWSGLLGWVILEDDRVMKIMLVGLLFFVLFGCGGDPVSPEAEALSAVMSIANVSREPVLNANGDIVGVNLSAEIVNTGPVPIISPVVMTWRLRVSNDEIARTTHRFTGFGIAQVQGVALTLTFEARSSLSGVQDVVTFDFEGN